MKARWAGSLKIKIALLFSLLIAIAFSINWKVATGTIEGEKREDLEKVLHHLLAESVDEYITVSLTEESNLSFLYSIPHNRMILHDSEASHLRFRISKKPILPRRDEISAAILLSNTLYLNAISDDHKLRSSVNKYAEKLLIRYGYSLLVILIISILFLEYFMRPLGALAHKTRNWKNGDPFAFSLDNPCTEIEEVSDAFSALIRRLEGFRAKEKALFKEAAHELKTPLALMRSRLDVYEKSEGYAKGKFVADLGHDVERLTAELKNVLFLESSDFEDPVSVDINRSLRAILKKVDILAHQKELKIHLSLRSFTVQASEKLLNKVLMALIDNAMTYAAQGSLIEIVIDPECRTLSVINVIGEEKYLFSSKIGEKMLRRISEDLQFTYAIINEGSVYRINLTFV
ncbi:MAG: HAMP domain-containing histidine kinase [Sulfuricurvum sp.]|uniref:sensor histidine kinase n=1 Tax=Sulfuricurvum sp. TaxID=2025608 RepID=UPI0025CF54C1|nr:HAMP domain-containing sensor histidine kinase [Sulfuricurvum sp.]MCK9371830.1 HAMP domain-containing histidine kinase [Sulfuricurvum sp.]